jgi:hypothetical protein
MVKNKDKKTFLKDNIIFSLAERQIIFLFFPEGSLWRKCGAEIHFSIKLEGFELRGYRNSNQQYNHNTLHFSQGIF